MSCLTCGSIPCCCPIDVVCPEAVTYGFENANLAGVGVFGAVEGTSPSFLVRFRGVQGVAPISATYNNVTKAIEIELDTSSLKLQQTAVDNAQRASLTPAYLGQLLVQINTQDIYIGTSLVAGGWTIYTP